MSKTSKSIKAILSSKDILLPNEQFPGISLKEEDFISFEDLFEISRQETLKKYITLRDIANKMIAKDGIIQGIAYSETDRPQLYLLFKGNYPLGYLSELQEFNKNIKEYSGEKTEIHTNNGAYFVNNELDKALKEYQSQYAEVLERIQGFNIPYKIATINGKIAKGNNEYDEKFPCYAIDEQMLGYLLNSSKISSPLELEVAKEYYDELCRYQEAIECGILYPDFDTVDYTGSLRIASRHDGLVIYEQSNVVEIPKNFGRICVYLPNNSFRSLVVDYYGYNDTIDITSDIKNAEEISTRGFAHKALLPKAYHTYKED